MKKYLIIAIMLIATAALAGTEELNFGWDKNTETDLAGYRLYFSQTAGSYVKKSVNPASPNFIAEIPVFAGSHPDTHTTQVQAADGSRIYFVLTAFDMSGNESGLSNEVSYTMTDTTAPAPPKGFWARLSRIIQSVIDFLRGGLRLG